MVILMSLLLGSRIKFCLTRGQFSAAVMQLCLQWFYLKLFSLNPRNKGKTEIKMIYLIINVPRICNFHKIFFFKPCFFHFISFFDDVFIDYWLLFLFQMMIMMGVIGVICVGVIFCK